MKTMYYSDKNFSLIFTAYIKIYPLLPVLFLFNQPLGAQTRLVPAEYPTIQSAVDAAQEGDTVLVSPGVYVENVQLRGRNIVLSSRFALDQNPALIEQTVIDGGQPQHPDTASCLLIWKGETAATVVEGFTFRHGAGTVWLDPAGFGTFREGGGILTEFSSPVIRHNIIRDNVVAAPGPGLVSNGGGGIRCGDGAPLIENNRIVHNRGDGYGGGIVLNYCPGAVVRNNVIAFNTGGKDYSGGGFWSTGKDQSTLVVLQNNVIAFNQSPAGAQQFSGKGGGIWTFSIRLQGRNNIVWGNTQASGKQVDQAGSALVDLRFNCIQAGTADNGNITGDPLFADTVCFQLSPGSPCIDAGDPAPAVHDFSRNGQAAAFPGRGTLHNDMGAYGGPGKGPLLCNPFWVQPKIFTKVTNSPVVNTPGDSRSVNWVDIDGDEDLDLFISNGPQAGENNFLYRNTGKGGFERVQNDPIVQDNKPSDGATWADYDNDGDNDCFVANWYNANNLLYRNKGNGTFEQITTGSPVTDAGYSETAAWGDYDKDGWLDLYVTNSEGAKRNFLYRNSGNGTFTKVTSGTPVTDAFISRCVNWTDVDDDGDPDLFVTNENDQNENLYRNNSGQFIKTTSGSLVADGGKTMSSSWGDYDNDGDQDVFLANDQGNDALFQNNGNGNFTKITTGPVVSSGGNSFGSQWGDVDNDGDLDLFVTNAFWGGPWRNFLFINQGNGVFLRNLIEAPVLDDGWSYGCAFGDMDRDGDLDLAVANCYNATQPDYLYENHAAEGSNNWLAITCVGKKSNKSAIGAKVRVLTTIGGVQVNQVREISAQSGYCGQNQLPAHFGLGDASVADSVEVRWPSGVVERYGNVFPNQYITLIEEGGVTKTRGPLAGLPGVTIYPVQPNPFSDSVQCRFDLSEPTQLTIEVLDQSGQMVRRLANRVFSAGTQGVEWDGFLDDGSSAPAGAYLIRLITETGQATRLLVRAGGKK